MMLIFLLHEHGAFLIYLSPLIVQALCFSYRFLDHFLVEFIFFVSVIIMYVNCF